MPTLPSIAVLPILYISLWIAAGLVVVGAVLIARSQWGRQRPLHRCVLLSLAAHLVLIGVAATVRFVSWPPEEGTAEPVRITIVASAPFQAEVTPKEVTPNETVTPSKEVAAEESDLPPEPVEEPLEAPDLLDHLPEKRAPVEATPAPETVTPTTTPLAESPLAESSPVETPPVETTGEDSELAETLTAEAVVAEPVEAELVSVPAQPVPAALAERTRPDRLQKVIEQGGSRDTEQAVGRALEWLAAAQSSDGRWDSDRWHGGRETAVLGHHRGGAGGHADTGISALALLTFLGAGHSHLEGPYRQTVAEGLHFLIRSQAADGNLYGSATLYARTYCHSMATFALAEAYALTGDHRLKKPVREAVDFLVRTQNKTGGGWRYRPGNRGDVSQLGWIIMALRSAELAGVPVPDKTWQRIEHFLSLVTRGDRGGLAAYQPRGQVSRAMTAEALYCRQVLGKPPVGSALNETLISLEAQLPGDQQANFYYWYYATLALHHAQDQGNAARHTWNQWNDRLKGALLHSQVTDGSNDGSWSPHTVWGGYGGRVYSTAMATMCLEVYYRFGSSQGDESPWVATRPRGQSLQK